MFVNTFSVDLAIFSKPYLSVLNLDTPKSWFNYQYFRPNVGCNINRLSAGKYIPDYIITESTDITELAEKVKENIEMFVFPYVEKLYSTTDLIEEIERQVNEGSGATLPPVAQYDLVPLYCITGNKKKAEEALVYAWERGIDNPYYKPKLTEIAQKLGMNVPE